MAELGEPSPPEPEEGGEDCAVGEEGLPLPPPPPELALELPPGRLAVAEPDPAGGREGGGLAAAAPTAAAAEREGPRRGRARGRRTDRAASARRSRSCWRVRAPPPRVEGELALGKLA